MAELSDKAKSFMEARVAYLQKLQNRTEQQEMFVELAQRYLGRGEESTYTAAELRALKTLLAAEQAAEKAAAASRAARKLVAEKTEAARKRETRQKILLGAFCMHRIQNGQPIHAQNWGELKAQLDGFLTRDEERALFDLPPRTNGMKDVQQGM